MHVDQMSALILTQLICIETTTITRQTWASITAPLMVSPDVFLSLKDVQTAQKVQSHAAQMAPLTASLKSIHLTTGGVRESASA